MSRNADKATRTLAGAGRIDEESRQRHILHTFASPGSATLNCVTPLAQAAQAGYVRITAIQVSNIS
jgi:hypothetical protein